MNMQGALTVNLHRREKNIVAGNTRGTTRQLYKQSVIQIRPKMTTRLTKQQQPGLIWSVCIAQWRHCWMHSVFHSSPTITNKPIEGCVQKKNCTEVGNHKVEPNDHKFNFKKASRFTSHDNWCQRGPISDSMRNGNKLGANDRLTAGQSPSWWNAKWEGPSVKCISRRASFRIQTCGFPILHYNFLFEFCFFWTHSGKVLNPRRYEELDVLTGWEYTNQLHSVNLLSN